MTQLKIDHQGGCSCGYVRYQVAAEPLVTHCCHCRICQQQTGSAFAVNALFDSFDITLISGEIVEFLAATPSGQGQAIARCKKCKVAVWSHYFMGGIKAKISFLRVGTLDNPDLFPPDVHIFVTSKQPWVCLPNDAKVYDSFYDYAVIWSQKNNQHRQHLLAISTQK